MLILAIRAASSDLVQAVTTALLTILVLFAIVVIVGFTILARRKARGTAVTPSPAAPGGSTTPSGDAELATRANILLVRLDDAVAQANDDLGFAIAQFGDERSRSFADALAAAKRDLTESFRLKQRLDDSQPDTATQQREWNGRIIHLCESSQKTLTEEAETFDALRRRETDAPTALGEVRMLVVATSMRVPTSESTLAVLAGRYSPGAIATVSGNVSEARELLTTAGQGAEAANGRLADPLATDVADRVQDARATATRAVRLLDAVDALGATLSEQSDRLSRLASQSQADLAEARIARDSAPDPISGAAIGSAVAAIESVLGSLPGSGLGSLDTGDPATSLTRLEGSVATLDSALATARNQTQRLEHASAALGGVLVSARSQIAATQDFITSRRGGVGTDARTRLAEAQRLLEVAEAQSDPVAALDSARSSATYSRDADALARFDAHG